MPNEISPKVHSGTASAGIGGSAAAVLLLWIMQAVGVPPEQLTPERVIAMTGACAWVGSYLGGYFKSA